jgi:acyl-CoA synthetase (AMP-forming)/AMP-acid ligase II
MIYLVQQYISRAAKQTPDKVAVACQDEKITYGALDRFTNAFARELRRAGVLRGSFVPFFMKKSCRSIVSLISILKADAAYVPVDFTSPQQRLLSILESTKAKVIIVDDESEPLLRTLLEGRCRVRVRQSVDRCCLHVVYIRLNRHAQGSADSA